MSSRSLSIEKVGRMGDSFSVHCLGIVEPMFFGVLVNNLALG